jgi:hypothetical protein
MRKNLDISEEAVKALKIQAIQKGFPDFKNYAQHILEEAAKSPWTDTPYIKKSATKLPLERLRK